MRAIRKLRSTWRGLGTWHGRDAGHSQTKGRDNREPKLQPKPARQSSTLPERARGRNSLAPLTSSSKSAARRIIFGGVSQDGNVLDILVQSQRNAKAATRFFKKLLKGLRYAPRVMITDKLASYGAARKQMCLSIEHR